jgi:hypothetical protein
MGIYQLDDVQLANYVAGIDPGPVHAGRVDQKIASVLCVKAGTIVWLSDYTLTKTKYRHPEIDFADYRKIPEILSSGFAVAGKKKRTIELCHIDTGSSDFKLWRVILKTTSRNEVFVTLFHRLDMKEARRLYRRARKKGALLRDHKNELARRTLHRASRT